MLVLKEETVATSLAGLVCDPSAFIVEEYSEEVMEQSSFFGVQLIWLATQMTNILIMIT